MFARLLVFAIFSILTLRAQDRYGPKERLMTTRKEHAICSWHMRRCSHFCKPPIFAGTSGFLTTPSNDCYYYRLSRIKKKPLFGTIELVAGES